MQSSSIVSIDPTALNSETSSALSTLIKQSNHKPFFAQQYELSAMPHDNKPENYADSCLYVTLSENALHYAVINPSGKLVNDKIAKTDLIAIIGPEAVDSLEPFLPQKIAPHLTEILDVLSHRGHAHKPYSVKNNEMDKTINLKNSLFCHEKSIPALGLSKKKYEVQSDLFLGKGAYGSVYESLGTLKIKEGNVEFSVPSHKKIIKRESLQQYYSESDIDDEFDKKGFYKQNYNHFRKESNLMFNRAQYTHAKKTINDDSKGYADHNILISRKFPGAILDDQFKVLTPVQRVTAALSMLKKYITQIEDNKLIHYDVKPSNFMFDRHAGRGNYFDFGFSEKAESGLKVDVGSTMYQAFEIFRREQTGKKTDYFALGRSLQELFGDSSIPLAYAGGPKKSGESASLSSIDFELAMRDLYAFLNIKKLGIINKINQRPFREFIKDLHSLNHLYEDYDLKNSLSAHDKIKIKYMIAQLLQHRMQDRPDSLDKMIYSFLLIQMQLKYKMATNKDSNEVVTTACNAAFNAFQESRSASFENVLALKVALLGNAASLTDDQMSIDIYTDFLELDAIPAVKNKEELCQQIRNVFDSYSKTHDKLIEHLQCVSKMISERQTKSMSASDMLTDLFFDICSQLSRKERCTCHFNEIAELTSSWQKKLVTIEKKMTFCMSCNPFKQVQSDSVLSPEHIEYTEVQRKKLKSGLKFMRAHCKEEVIKYLDSNRHNAAMLLNNCFIPMNDDAAFFQKEFVPCVDVFSQINVCYKKIRENEFCRIKNTQRFINEIIEFFEKGILLPLINHKMVDHALISELNMVAEHLAGVKSDTDCSNKLLAIVDTVNPLLAAIINNAFVSTSSSSTASVVGKLQKKGSRVLAS